MNKSFNETLAEVSELIKAVRIRKKIDSYQVMQTIFEMESWVHYFATKDPSQEMFAIKNQMEFLERITENPTSDNSFNTCAGIFLKGKYDPDSDTRKLSVMKRDFLQRLSDSQLITLKETVRSAQFRLNQRDPVGIMKVLNNNRVLIDEILIGRIEPATKLNGLLD